MRTTYRLLINVACSAVMLVHAASGMLVAQGQHGQRESALTGQVTSSEEGPMEGVLVSARKAGSTLTITVVSDQRGRYRFPRARLDSGQYRVQIRAIGYELESGVIVEIRAQET